MLQPSSISSAARSADLRLTARALDRDRAHGECRQRAGDAGREEVVGGGADDELVPPRLGDRRDEQRRVEVAVVVGREDDRPVLVEVSETVEAGALGFGDAAHARPRHRALDDQHPRDASRQAPGPLGVVVGAGASLLRQRLDAVRAPRLRGTGTPQLRALGASRLTCAADSCTKEIGRSRDVRHEHRRVVEVGDRRLAADDVAGHLERVVQRRRGREAEPAHGPRVAADDDHLGRGAAARARPSTTCRTGGRRGRRSSCGRGGGTTRPRRTASRTCASISTGSVVSASTCSKKSM